MSLLDAIAAEVPAHRGRTCEFGQWLESISPEEAAAVRDAFGKIPDRRLADLIASHGYNVSYSTVANHRRNTCLSCRS